MRDVLDDLIAERREDGGPVVLDNAVHTAVGTKQEAPVALPDPAAYDERARRGGSHRPEEESRPMVSMRLAATPAALLLAATMVASGSHVPGPESEGVAPVGPQLEQGAPASDRAEDMGFFITSEGIGRGGDLGGLEGADAHCQTLAEGAGAGDRTWHAYLSTQETDQAPAVHARHRIGHGPWHNAEGLLIASDVEDLHYNNANIRYEYALNERGERVSSGAMGDSPNLHDILTGTRIDGTAFPPGEDRTCQNWTSSGEGSAFIGHHDRFTFQTPGSSWNTAHASRGCSQDDLVATGGAGLFYCFAVD